MPHIHLSQSRCHGRRGGVHPRGDRLRASCPAGPDVDAFEAELGANHHGPPHLRWRHAAHNDSGRITRTRHLSTQPRQPVGYYQHAEIASNYRLTNILAALGRAQLSRLDGMLACRREVREMYADGFADIPGVSFLGRDEHRGNRGDSRSDDEKTAR